MQAHTRTHVLSGQPIHWAIATNKWHRKPPFSNALLFLHPCLIRRKCAMSKKVAKYFCWKQNRQKKKTLFQYLFYRAKMLNICIRPIKEKIDDLMFGGILCKWHSGQMISLSIFLLICICFFFFFFHSLSTADRHFSAIIYLNHLRKSLMGSEIAWRLFSNVYMCVLSRAAQWETYEEMVHLDLCAVVRLNLKWSRFHLNSLTGIFTYYKTYKCMIHE